jgi:hypothetical protein
VEALVARLSWTNVGEQEQAAAALRVLSANADNQTRIVEEVKHLLTPTPPAVLKYFSTSKFKYYWH